MKERIALLLRMGLLCFLAIILASQSLADSSAKQTPESQSTRAAWEYAQLTHTASFHEKSPEHLWRWASAEDGVIGVRDARYNPALLKLRSKMKGFEGLKQKGLIDSTVVLLDSIGATGWELVDYSEKIRHFSLSTHKPCLPCEDSYEHITETWPFKRLKASPDTPQKETSEGPSVK